MCSIPSPPSGPHKIDLAYDGAPVPGAPFTVTAKPGCDPRKVTADGPGLKRGIVNKSNTFKVNTRGRSWLRGWMDAVS